MATRLYPTARAAEYTPSTIRGTWDKTSDHIVRYLAFDKDEEQGNVIVGGGNITAIGSSETVATNPYSVLLGRWVSPALDAQTISGTIDLVLSCFQQTFTGFNDGDVNLHWHLHIYVTSGDTDTPRGTLLTDYTEAAGVNEWPTPFGMGHTLNSPASLSSLAITKGDRLVIEIGYVARNADTFLNSGFLRYGTQVNGVTVGDLTNDSTSTLAGHFDFSDDITEPLSDTIVTQYAIEIASFEPPIPSLVTQLSIEIGVDLSVATINTALNLEIGAGLSDAIVTALTLEVATCEGVEPEPEPEPEPPIDCSFTFEVSDEGGIGCVISLPVGSGSDGDGCLVDFP